MAEKRLKEEDWGLTLPIYMTALQNGKLCQMAKVIMPFGKMAGGNNARVVCGANLANSKYLW